MTDQLTGEIVLVTGSGRRNGIGYGIAKVMAELGASVVVTDLCTRSIPDADFERNAREELRSIAAELSETGQQCLGIEADVSNSQQIADLFSKIEQQIGPVSVLVNNAGVCYVKPLIDTTLAEWELSLKVNLTGTFLCCQEAARGMIKHGISGNIINISSISGKEGWRDYGAYSASKFGVISLTQTLARELASSGIRVNAICPGLIDTGMNRINNAKTAALLKTSIEEVEKSQLSRIPLERLGSARDVANVVAFLVSENAGYLTGQSINVTGGLMVH